VGTVTIYGPEDLPPGRAADSFRYHVQFLWDGAAVEDYYTDDPAERDRLVRAADEGEYDVLVQLGGRP
jgi:hypothetical protein